jgi:hypothetical protein
LNVVVKIQSQDWEKKDMFFLQVCYTVNAMHNRLLPTKQKQTELSFIARMCSLLTGKYRDYVARAKAIYTELYAIFACVTVALLCKLCVEVAPVQRPPTLTAAI